MDQFPNRRWLVIPASEVENVNFSQVLDAGPDSLRYSLDGFQTFVKYEVQVLYEPVTYTWINPETGQEETTTIPAGTYGRPDIYNGVYPEYMHEPMLELLAGPEWTDPNPPITE
jgi:hypothetical protein